METCKKRVPPISAVEFFPFMLKFILLPLILYFGIASINEYVALYISLMTFAMLPVYEIYRYRQTTDAWSK